MTPRGRALVVFAVLAALSGLEVCRTGNPDPAPEGAPADQFSATRAIAALHAVSLDEPHPLGTPAHDAMRDKIAAALGELGYTVERQHAFACNAAATCGDVDNLIARRPGQALGARAVVVAAHYDSVPAGPGASDDGTGVASALEIARAIRGDALANPVVFLIDDGEEAGLLGAEGFVADSARSKDAAFVINLEARGTGGTPFLFETSREQRWLIPIVARALPHPVTTSLFATANDQLPNDTDLTVFKRAGRAGINFAYIGGGTQYHTPLDNFADIDAGSVQRRGDQALAMVRAFGAANLDDAAPGGAVWFDVFAAFVVWWPVGWTVWIAAAALALVAVAVVRGMRRGELVLGGVALGVASFAGSVVLAVALGVGLTRLLGLAARGALFEPHPEPKIAAAWFVGIAAALAVTGLARRGASFASVFAGHALAWNALALVVSAMLPGAAYLFAVPGLVMAVLAVLPVAGTIASLGSLAAAAAVCLPFALTGYDALGDTSLTVTAVLLALVATAFAPLVSDTAARLAPGCFALAVILGVVAVVIPRHSATHPLHESLAYALDSDAGAARWQIDHPTPEVRAAAAFEPAPRIVAPWYGALGTSDVAPAPAEVIPPPVATASATAGDATRVVTLEVSSARRAPRLTIAWHSDAEVVGLRINGVVPPPHPARWRSFLAPGWSRIAVRGSTARVEIT
ncbi:MAG TPA: M28 family peptidase, partial [Kofleriaceae bacterium]